MDNVIVVSTHPDDEMFGAGGTLLKHVENNDSITWLIITSMLESEGYSSERVSSRNKEIDKIVKEVGIENVVKLDIPVMGMG